jgi:ribosomal protein S18 acetylase RimI-like enzyme
MTMAKAKIEDLPEILQLQKLCYQENAKRYNDYNIPPLTQTLEELKNEYSNSIILKAEENSKIIGSIRAYEKNNICYIGRVIVHPDYQNRGIGKKMMAEIESRFPQAKKFELFTGYKDEKNIYFYTKLGYKIFKEESHGDNLKFVFLEKTNN